MSTVSILLDIWLTAERSGAMPWVCLQREYRAVQHDDVCSDAVLDQATSSSARHVYARVFPHQT